MPDAPNLSGRLLGQTARFVDALLGAIGQAAELVDQVLTGRSPTARRARCSVCDHELPPLANGSAWLCAECARLFGWDGVTPQIEINVATGLPIEVDELDDSCRGWLWTDCDGDEYRSYRGAWQWRIGGVGDETPWINIEHSDQGRACLTNFGPYTRGTAL